MQATTMSGSKLEKRYSPSFHEDSSRKQSASKRKRDDVLRLVFFLITYIVFLFFAFLLCDFNRVLIIRLAPDQHVDE